MREIEIYERRAREAEELAQLVNLPQNRSRYLAIASAWRELLAVVEAGETADSTKAA